MSTPWENRPHPGRRILGVVVLVALALLAVRTYNRSRPPPEVPLAPEITIGAAPTDQQPVVLSDSLWDPKTGLADGGAWPPACQLLSDAEITAVLPQAILGPRSRDSTEIDYVTPEIFNFPDGSFTSAYPSRRIQVPQSGCGTDVELPALTNDDGEDFRWTAVSIRVDVEAVGDPETVAYFFDRSVDGLDGIADHPPSPDQFGAERCVEMHPYRSPDGVSSTISCRKARMSVKVEVSVRPQTPFLNARLAGQPTNTDRARVLEVFEQQVLPQFHGAVFRRLP